MARSRRYRWRGFGEQARTPPRRKNGAAKKTPPDPLAPATGKQINFVRNLRRRLGVPMSGDATRKPLSQLTKADASAEIERLLRRGG